MNDDASVDPTELAERITPFVRLALDCVRRPYPAQMPMRLGADADLALPKQLTPVFYGCYDWHSAVHGHWVLARAARLAPSTPIAEEARKALRESFQADALEAEADYLRAHPAFERPYGLAWLLQLHGELSEAGLVWADALWPMAEIARDHMAGWLKKLSHPSRVGTHAQTAFAMGLCYDWAQHHDNAFAALLSEQARHFFGDDHSYALHLEPGGEDFLSPSLGAADLMRRVLPRDELSKWMTRTFPGGISFQPATVVDKSDGRLAHLDGLNLSRAWMLENLSVALEDGALLELSRRHAEPGLVAADGADYAGGHWLGTFAIYLITRRGR